MSLKALANKVLERDSRGDTGGTSLSQTCPTPPTPVGQDIGAESTPEIDVLAFDERAAIIEFDGEIPREWAEGLARLCTMPQPSNVTSWRWRQAVDAAGRSVTSGPPRHRRSVGQHSIFSALTGSSPTAPFTWPG